MGVSNAAVVGTNCDSRRTAVCRSIAVNAATGTAGLWQVVTLIVVSGGVC